MRTWQANVLGALGASAVLAVGFVVGAPPARASAQGNAARIGMVGAHADAQGEVSMGAGLEVWGQPAQVNLFWTPDDSATVSRTYLSAWNAAGLITDEKRMGNVTLVSALEESTGLMRTVTVLDGQGDDRLVLPGLTDIRSIPDPTPRGAPVPVPANAAAYLAHVADDILSISYSGSFIAPLAPDRIVRFYELELDKGGYERQPGLGPNARADAGEWQRGPETVTVSATQFDKDNPQASFVVVTHVRALDADAGDGR